MSRIDESKPFLSVNIAILTVSDSRTPETDKSGDTLAERVAAAGHRVAGRRHPFGERVAGLVGLGGPAVGNREDRYVDGKEGLASILDMTHRWEHRCFPIIKRPAAGGEQVERGRGAAQPAAIGPEVGQRALNGPGTECFP